MEYLIKKKNSKVVHIWIKTDTVCRLYSTGGMNKKRYKVVKDRGNLPICSMCDKSEIDYRSELDKYSMQHFKSII